MRKLTLPVGTPVPGATGATVALIGREGFVWVDVATGTRRPFPYEPEGAMSWSPDGSKIAVVMGAGDAGHGHLYVVDAATGAKKRLVGPLPADFDNDDPMAGTPVFSPDGSRIAFVFGSWQNTGRWTVRAVPTGGGTITTLATSRPGAVVDALQDWTAPAAADSTAASAPT